MAVINVTSGSQAILTLGNTAPLAVPGVTNGLAVPLVQDITVNATTGSTDYYVHGTGFISGLSPSASMDQAVWITPMEIIVNGELTKATV